VLEELVFEQEQELIAARSSGTLPVRSQPRFEAWCTAQSAPEQFFLCAWVKPSCPYFGSVGSAPATGDGPMVTTPPKSPEPLPAKPERSPITSRTLEESVPPVTSSDAPSDSAPLGPAPIELGAQLQLERTLLTEPGHNATDGAIIQYDYELRPTNGAPVAISGAGFHQSYLIFGGPGAGKTHLFKYLLEQVLASGSRPGALILDPKGLLIDELREIVGRSRREKDLIAIDGGNLAEAPRVNVLAYTALEPRDLGRLVAEVVLSEAGDLPEGWQVHVSDLIESATVLIAAGDSAAAEPGAVTPAVLARDLLTKNVDGTVPIAARTIALQDDTREPVVEAVRRLTEYFGPHTEPNQRRFVRQIIQRSLSELKDSKWACLSEPGAAPNLYEQIINDGKIVVLSVGQGSPAFQRTLCTLMKALFQQAVLTHGAAAIRSNRDPKPTLLACDEYAQVATESASGLVSDSRFFSLAREFCCMSLLALQSVATGKSRFPGHLQDRWDAILGNIGAKVFMRLNDMETAQLASDLVGSRECEVPLRSYSSGLTDKTMTANSSLAQRVLLPPWLLTQKIVQGQGVAIGTLDGGRRVGADFFATPAYGTKESADAEHCAN
jgi:hypothetical protein